MSNAEALKELETMSTQRFNSFLLTLPERVQMLVRSGMCNWREVLPEWYVKYRIENGV